MIQHALHTFGGRRIETPLGGTTAAPPPLEDFGPTVKGHRSVAMKGGHSMAWRNLAYPQEVYLRSLSSMVSQRGAEIFSGGWGGGGPPPGGFQLNILVS